jgi:hypothetical protein
MRATVTVGVRKQGRIDLWRGQFHPISEPKTVEGHADQVLSVEVGYGEVMRGLCEVGADLGEFDTVEVLVSFTNGEDGAA